MKQDQGEGTVQKAGQGLRYPHRKVVDGKVLGRAGGQGQQDQVAIQQEIGGADTGDQHRQVHRVYGCTHGSLHGQYHDAGRQCQHGKGQCQHHQDWPADHGGGTDKAAHQHKHQ